MRRYELTKEQWDWLKALLPPEHKRQGGRPAKDNRLMLNAMLYRLNTGIAWRDLPKRYGPWQSVYSRYRTWLQLGVWEKLAENLVFLGLLQEPGNNAKKNKIPHIPPPDSLFSEKKHRYF